MTEKLRLHIRLEPGNSLFQEWTFDHPTRVTIGFSSSASVWVFDTEAGPDDELFIRGGHDLRLRVLPALKGSIEIEGKQVALEALRSAGLLKVDSKGEYVTLQSKTTGHLHLGKTPLQFWVTPTPKEPEFPAHPIHLRLIHAMPWETICLFFVALFVEWCGLQMIRNLPPPEPPSAEEMTRYYARFEMPSSTYVTERLKGEKNVASSTETAAEETPKRNSKPLPSKAQGFLSAVASSRSSGKDSPFSTLFTASALTNEMEKALKNSGGFEKLTKEGLKNFGKNAGSGSLDENPKMIGIGSIQQKTDQKASLNKVASAPGQSDFSYEGSAGGGDFDRNALENLIRSRAGELRDCYERAISRNPSLSGKIVVRLILRPTGKPLISVDDRSSLKDLSLQRCILSRMDHWPFQTPKLQTDPIALPFIFSPASRG